ncbi:hypothetical protein ACFWIY_14635 [Streptomyces sioyaensis]|uniref:hypothetical protein n=1 Tax=Streptomyces sioyaensis TaxID=67364 RepID=UPI00364F77AA
MTATPEPAPPHPSPTLTALPAGPPLQREVPEAALSRVSSYDWFGSLAFAPLGLLVAGPVAAHLGVSRALAGCAALIVLATAAALLSPQVRGLRAPRPAPGGEAPDGS